MEDVQYDVVVVGSGVAGAIVAKTLTQAGKKVLLLEAGLEAGIALDEDGSHDAYRGYLNNFYTKFPKAPNVPYPNIPQAPSIDVLDLAGFKNGQNLTSGYLVQKGPLPFASDAIRAAGGTTHHWLGTTLRLLPNDFKMKTTYGRGVDWPFDYNTLKPYYEMAEFEIGVSGDVKEQIRQLPGVPDDYFGKDYALPMQKIPISYLDGKVRTKFEEVSVSTDGKNKIQVKCCSTPQGRNSTPNDQYPHDRVKWMDGEQKLKLVNGRENKDPGYSPVGSVWNRYKGQRCEGNSSCVPICPVQAKYDALKTIKSANQDNLDIIAQAVAYKVLLDPVSKKVSGIRYKKYRLGDPPDAFTDMLAHGKIYVLACSSISNATLLLSSGVANSSDQVGRNLMDHLCLLTWGLFPVPVFPFRGPGSTTNICSFRDGDFRRDHTAWICPLDNWGWGWPVFSPGSDVEEFVGNGMFGPKLREAVNNRITRQVLLHFECEQDPDPENRVIIDSNFTDVLGNFRPVIRYNVSDYVLKAFEAAKQISDMLFKHASIEDHTKYDPARDQGFVTYNGQGYTYRGAGHIVGTHRMGNDPKTSVVNENMQTWDHENLYLVGCGNMPTLGTSNPTLTMAATTFKAAEAILKQLSSLPQ